MYMYLVWMTFTILLLTTQSPFSATVYTCVHVHTLHTCIHACTCIYNKCMCTCCDTLVYQMVLSFCSHSHQSYRYLHCKICILYLQNRVSEMLVTNRFSIIHVHDFCVYRQLNVEQVVLNLYLSFQALHLTVHQRDHFDCPLSLLCMEQLHVRVYTIIYYEDTCTHIMYMRHTYMHMYLIHIHVHSTKCQEHTVDNHL